MRGKRLIDVIGAKNYRAKTMDNGLVKYTVTTARLRKLLTTKGMSKERRGAIYQLLRYRRYFWGHQPGRRPASVIARSRVKFFSGQWISMPVRRRRCSS